MAIRNRDLDVSEQTQLYDKQFGAVAVSITNIVGMVPYAAQIEVAALKAFGLSGSPVYTLIGLRATATGFTTVPLGATLTALEGATNPAQGWSITLGATNLLQAGDLIAVQSSGANTASTTSTVSVVIKALSDVKSFYNQQIV